jgi:FkbM family methyltransferase
MSSYTTFHGEKYENKYVDQILREYFPDYNYKGVFIDIGAFDPIEISNSYHFEKNGWDCYCFEANTDLIPKLKEHRKHVFNYALYDTDKENIEFTVVHDGNWTAGFSAIELNKEYEKIFDCDTKTYKKICIPQKKLDTVITEELPTLQKIDIMSIDIEGGELTMLQGFNLIKKYPPKVIVIENVTNNIKYKEYLENCGYRLNKHVSYNQFYLFKE